MAEFLTPLKKSTMQAGEKRFAELLEKHLDDDYLIWFNIPTSGQIRRYPDFLIFHPTHGLWCIEIKDWHMGNIKGMDKQTILLGTEKIRTTHPLEQARSSCLPIIDRMKKDRYLCHESGKYQGKIRIPWGFSAVMSNWERARIKDSARNLLNDCFPPHLTWYKEDIMEGNLTQAEFLAKLHAILPYPFPAHLDHAQSQRVRAHIFPEFIIGAQGSLFEENKPFPEVVKVMDKQQERIARDLSDGHRVIHGVAGSGKTLILQHRARVLAANTRDKPVLIICYNTMLASILKSRLGMIDNINIFHFHDWCGEMNRQYQLGIKPGKDYPDRLASAVCNAIESGLIPSGQYHAVLIDEGHDFAADWLRALGKMPDSAHEHLLLLYDDAQTLYPNRRGINFTLSSVGIKARGRTRILHTNYRNSEEIHHYAQKFNESFFALPESAANEKNPLFNLAEETEGDDDTIPTVASESAGGHIGSTPQFHQLANLDEETNHIIKKIRQWRTEGAAWGDIAVLCYSKKQGEILAQALRAADIPLQHPVSSEERKNYRPNPEHLLVCTIHSSKGGEFPCVIAAGIHTLPDSTPEEQEQSARLLYVAITRAQKYLLLTASKDNSFTAILQQITP